VEGKSLIEEEIATALTYYLKRKFPEDGI
jgi:hypothetical protein